MNAGEDFSQRAEINSLFASYAKKREKNKENEAIFIHGNLYPQKLYTLPIYRNLPLMEESGLYSENGVLYSEYTPPFDYTEYAHRVVRYLPLGEDSSEQEESPDILDWNEKVNEIINATGAEAI